jgi:hypothetical protein
VLVCVRGSNRTDSCSQYTGSENGGRYERRDKRDDPLRLHDCLELTVRICEARLGIARTSWCDVTRPLLRAASPLEFADRGLTQGIAFGVRKIEAPIASNLLVIPIAYLPQLKKRQITRCLDNSISQRITRMDADIWATSFCPMYDKRSVFFRATYFRIVIHCRRNRKQ